MSKQNGGIIGPDNVTTGGFTGVASGVFKLGEVTKLIRESKWPEPSPFPTNITPNSARFNTASSDSLTRTQSASPTSATKGTLSFWIKRSLLGTAQYFMSTFQDSNNRVQCEFQANDTLRIIQKNSSSTTINIITNRVFRDPNSWYHVVLAFDTTQGTDSNRVKLYINGDQETSFSTSTYPGSGIDSFLTKGTSASLGAYNGSGDYSSAYFSEIVLIDGQQLTPTSFGETNSDSGIWVPKSVSGLTFGTNGYYLDFKDSSALGNDANGSNNFTVNNLTSIDQTSDSPSNNFATLNPLIYTDSTILEGNLQYTSPGSNPVFGSLSSIGMGKGKWYGEVKYVSGSNHYLVLGVADETFKSSSTTSSYDLGKSGTTSSIAYVVNTGAYRINNSNTSWGSAGGDGQIIMWAIDRVNNKIYFGVNGTWGASSDPAANSGGIPTTALDSSTDWFIGCTNDTGSTETVAQFNFGSPPFALSSAVADGNGLGQFEYAPPTGYVSLCTNNLNVLE